MSGPSTDHPGARARLRHRRPALRRCSMRLGVLASALALGAAASSCSSADDDRVVEAAAEPTTTSTTTTTTTTIPATTTTSTTTTSTTTTTTSTTTTLFPPPPILPGGPIDPPLDPRAEEPVIELGRIEIPKIGVDSVLYQGIRLTTLDRGPGHWPGAALPGEVGNTVIAGHRTSHNRVFRDVDQLEPGDEIVFNTYDGRHVYRVNRVEIVLPDAVWIVDPTETATATLFACHPPGSIRERIVVFADLVTD